MLFRRCIGRGVGLAAGDSRRIGGLVSRMINRRGGPRRRCSSVGGGIARRGSRGVSRLVGGRGGFVLRALRAGAQRKSGHRSEQDERKFHRRSSSVMTRWRAPMRQNARRRSWLQTARKLVGSWNSTGPGRTIRPGRKRHVNRRLSRNRPAHGRGWASRPWAPCPSITGPTSDQGLV